MEKHATDTCPLCEELFTCKVNSIFNCDCMKIDMTSQEATLIRHHLELTLGTSECVCNRCLLKLKKEFQHQNH
ncbi:cysteine-rich CWC family protein [Jiulongibacter sp. NS-SX5]|uniref:cysteine-rich CWC family protein n=1 Tax=Jiulongibacter sp. NS-SX5 TaxID=3463854 RepID=UPI004058D267